MEQQFRDRFAQLTVALITYIVAPPESCEGSVRCQCVTIMAVSAVPNSATQPHYPLRSEHIHRDRLSHAMRAHYHLSFHTCERTNKVHTDILLYCVVPVVVCVCFVGSLLL